MEAFVCLLVAVVGYSIHMLLRGRQWTAQQRLERAVQWWFGGGGLWLLVAASGHLFAADEVAKSIGWPPGSPFQREIGFSDLAWGVLGVLCIRMRGTFREAFVIGTGIFLWGAAGGHIYEMITEDNFSRNNSGLLLAIDILLPVADAALLWRLRVAEKCVEGVSTSRLGAATAAD
jgi:hypothetical protein